MRAFLAGLAACVVIGACAGGAVPGLMIEASPQVTATSPHILAALADPRRPEADRTRDALRHPAEVMAFAQIGPGDRVADLFPGGGYWTRMFAVAVGDAGRVYPTIRPEGVAGQYETPILPVAAQYPNAVMARVPYDALAFPEPLDVIFTAQNYHDLHIADYHLGDPMGMNRSAFAALKPGGYYIVIDHSAVDGSPVQTAGDSTIHRIDQAVVRREVESVGFIFDGEIDVLRNPNDNRTTNVFDPAIRGQTDQFVLRFRKPG